MTHERWLAPLRGITIRAFRKAFESAIREAGFTGAYAPFIPANPGIRVNNRLLADLQPCDTSHPFPLIPQAISKDPAALRILLEGFKAQGFTRADLNAGCPFPMIVRRGRGAGLFKSPDTLERLIAAGCEVMGPGNFSVKVRLGLERAEEILSLMPIFNRYPLAALTIHARTAQQMYTGACMLKAFRAAAEVSTNPILYNGDASLKDALPAEITSPNVKGVMIGRAFIRTLGNHPSAKEMLLDYIKHSQLELCGDHAVLGRVKELFTYWAEESPHWRRLWPILKMCRTVNELTQIL